MPARIDPPEASISGHRKYPDQVELLEVGPRDGFQAQAQVLPTPLKLAVISDLISAGLRRIQVTSFVSFARIPQMADAEELIKSLPRKAPVQYSALVLNAKGLERAVAAGIGHVEISISASDTHSRRNTGLSHDQARKQAADMITAAKKAHLGVRAGIQCAFGCFFEGELPAGPIRSTVRMFMDLGADEISLADTTGMGSPPKISRMLSGLVPLAGDIPLALHLHDTRGLGLINLLTALECGIERFDTSLGGMGGCPFIPGAAGNIATEDTVHLLSELGIHTGVNLGKVAACTHRLARYLKTAFPGKVYKCISPGE